MNPDEPGLHPSGPPSATLAAADAVRPVGAEFPVAAPAEPEHDGRLRNLLEWGGIILVAVLFALLVRGLAFQTFYIPSESMVPRLETNDRVLVNKLAYDFRDPARGDVTVFRTPPNANITAMDDLVKRIVGMPGETIEGRDGRIYINGELLDEPYLAPDVTSPSFAPVKIPANSYFMLGDNRQLSNDSHIWGPANRDLFVGPVFVTIWPLDRIDVPGWLWGIPIAIGVGSVLFFVFRKRDQD